MSVAGMSVVLPDVQPVPKSRKRRLSNGNEGTRNFPTRSMKQYPPEDKLEIIEHAKKNGNRAAGREFNVAESSIREWRKNEMKLIRSRDANLGMKNMNLTSLLNNNNNNNCQRLQEGVLSVPTVEVAMKLWSYELPTMLTLPNIVPQGNTRPGSNESDGTPNSSRSLSSSSSPPPSNSPSPSQPTGSGRRKIRAPQKIDQE